MSASTLQKAHAHAWLDSRAYRLAWLVGPMILALFTFGSIHWVTPTNQLALSGMPLRYTEEERARLNERVSAGDPHVIPELEAAAQSGDARAANYVASFFLPAHMRSELATKLDLPVDLERARALYQRGSDLGNPISTTNLGILLAPTNRAEACQYYLKAGESEHDFYLAYGEAGRCLFFGEDKSEDEKKKGLELIQKAIDGGDARAMSAMGEVKQVRRDFVGALASYEKAIAEGLFDGGYTYHLAATLLYDGENGVRRDVQRAIEYYRKGYEQGSAPSAGQLGYFYGRGLHGLPEDQKKSFEFAAFAAERGDMTGHHNLYVKYLYGRGTSRNWSKAASHLLTTISLGGERSALEFFESNMGRNKEFVTIVQQKLLDSGAYDGRVDGQLNERTKEAMRAVVGTRKSFN